MKSYSWTGDTEWYALTLFLQSPVDRRHDISASKEAVHPRGVKSAVNMQISNLCLYGIFKAGNYRKFAIGYDNN